MKNSFSIFIVVLFCAVLCVGLGFLNRDSSDSLGWNPNELYSNPVLSGGSSAFTNATISGADVNNVGVAVSMRGGRVTSSPFHHSSSAMYPSASSSYAPAGASYGQSSVATGSSPIAHMTSSAEYRSFGGGGNGGSVGSSSSRFSAASSAGAAVSVTSPISYSQSPIANRQSQRVYGTSDVTGSQSSAMDNPVVASSIYGTSSAVADYISTYGTASYDSYGSYGSNGRSNVRGRQNAAPGFGDGWWNWLDNWIKGKGSGTALGDADEDNDGYYDSGYLLDEKEIQKAYDDFIADYWNSGMGVPPTIAEWWEWYSSAMYTYGERYQYGDKWYYKYGNYLFTPVGDIVPLLIMALLYMLFLSLKWLRIKRSE